MIITFHGIRTCYVSFQGRRAKSLISFDTYELKQCPKYSV